MMRWILKMLFVAVLAKTKKGFMKLGDFGTAKVLDQGSQFAQTCIGTPYYMSPEVFMGKP